VPSHDSDFVPGQDFPPLSTTLTFDGARSPWHEVMVARDCCRDTNTKPHRTMTKLSCCLLALAAAQSCNAFVAPGNARADVRLDAKLEGRDIDGVLTPTNNFVLIKVADIQEETEGGILLTGSVSLKIFYYAYLHELLISTSCGCNNVHKT